MSTETLDKGLQIIRGATMSLDSDPQFAEMMKEKERLLVSKQLLLFIKLLFWYFPLKNVQVPKTTTVLLLDIFLLSLRLWKLPRRAKSQCDHLRKILLVHLIIRLSRMDTVMSLLLQNPRCYNECDFVFDLFVFESMDLFLDGSKTNGL